MIDSDLRKQMKTEAIGRMKSIRLYSSVVEDFEVEGNIQVYEPPQGAAYWLEEDEEERITQIENDQNILVWGVIRVFVNDDIDVDYLLYVSDNQENWPQERKDLTNHNPKVFAIKDESIDSLQHGRINIYMSSGGTPLRKGNSFVPEPIQKKEKENTCPIEYQYKGKDEEAFKLAVTLVCFYINHGVYKLYDICERLSDEIKIHVLPYIKSAYVGCKFHPSLTKEEYVKMDDENAIEAFDTDNKMLELQIKEWLEENFSLVYYYVDMGFGMICKGYYYTNWKNQMKSLVLKDHPEWKVWKDLNWDLFLEKLLSSHIEPDNQHFLSLNEWMLLKAFNS